MKYIYVCILCFSCVSASTVDEQDDINNCYKKTYSIFDGLFNPNACRLKQNEIKKINTILNHRKIEIHNEIFYTDIDEELETILQNCNESNLSTDDIKLMRSFLKSYNRYQGVILLEQAKPDLEGIIGNTKGIYFMIHENKVISRSFGTGIR